MATAVKSRKLNRLTALDVKNAVEPGFYLDGGGLYLQVSRFDSKSWIFRFTINGRVRDMGLGSVANWTLAQVRERAIELRQAVSQKIDPIERQREQRRGEAERLANQKTFAWCAEQCHQRLRPKWKNEKHALQWISTLREYAFPVVGDRVVADITVKHVADVLEPIWLSKRETAGRVRGRIREVLAWSSANGYYPSYSIQMWEELEKLLPVGRAPKTQHMASCPHHDAGRLLQVVRESSLSPLLKLAFEFTVLNAVRPVEGRGAEKSEIVASKRVWIIPDDRMKMGASHVVPLADQSLAIVERAKELAPGSALLFPNLATGSAYSDQAFTKVVLRETTGTTYTMHGFRSTFRTWVSNKTDYPREVAEFALAHNPQTDVEAAYNRTTLFSQRRKLMQEWADYLYATSTQAPVITEDDEFG